MPHPIPTQWIDESPKIIVAGNGPFATNLAQRLNATELSLGKLEGGPQPKNDGVFDRLLNDLESVLLVVPDETSAAEAMWYHHWLWDWVEKLTAGKDCHEICFVFVLPADLPAEFDRAIATSLSLAKVNSARSGHVIWRRSGRLDELVDLLRQDNRKDLQALRGRRKADFRRKSLTSFTAAVESDAVGVSWVEAANQVVEAFKQREHELDLFCLPPCHRNGNLLREWLHLVVTGLVTPELRKKYQSLLPSILNIR